MTDALARDAVIDGRYRLLEALEDWGVGECWRARDQRDHSRVALKFLPRVPDSDHTTGSEFRSLAKRLERIDHRGVVRTLSHGFWQGRPYLVTEWFEGTSLKRGLEMAHRSKHLLAAGMLANVLDRACEGIAAAHGSERAMVHGALQPASVVAALLDDQLVVRVMDFGLAPLFSARLANDASGEYAAPELEDDPGRRTAQSDVFSLGTIVMESIADRATVSGNAGATIGGLSAVAKRRDDLPSALTGVASRATRLDPDTRYEGVAALRAALANAWAPPDRPGEVEERRAPPPPSTDAEQPAVSSWVRFVGVSAVAPMESVAPLPLQGPLPALAPSFDGSSTVAYAAREETAEASKSADTTQPLENMATMISASPLDASEPSSIESTQPLENMATMISAAPSETASPESLDECAQTVVTEERPPISAPDECARTMAAAPPSEAEMGATMIAEPPRSPYIAASPPAPTSDAPAPWTRVVALAVVVLTALAVWLLARR